MKRICQPGWRLAALAVCAAVAAGCGSSRLPHYARPSVSFVDNAEMDMSDVIGYRRLTRDDFRGEQPPRSFDERMAAVTCVYTQPLVDKQAIEIVLADSEDGDPVYEVTYNNLRYRALMNRGCSWWNPKTGDLEEDYVLEHEQIHFALFEAAAREWNREPPLQVRVKRQEPEAMRRKVQKQYEEQLRERLAVLRAQNLRFDEETSLGHNPARQKQWLQKVMARLEENAAFAAIDEDEKKPACEAGREVRDAIERARRGLVRAADRSRVEHLIDEAEAAAAPPRCDDRRARILADQAIELIAD